MKRRAASAAAALLVLASCRSATPAPRPAGPDEALRAVSAVLAARDAAWAPRRFKALYRGEVSPRIGPVLRGYVALFWDGESLSYRASVPLVGGVRTGTIRRDGGDAEGLLPGRLAAGDVLAALLGVPQDAPTGEGAVAAEGGLELRLPSGAGRSVVVASDGAIVGLALPDGVRVELEPGAGVPRRIRVDGPEGSAILTLESFGPWPEGEEGAGT